MPLPTPGSPTFHANITLPIGADAPTLASVAIPLEELADRTKHIVTNFAYVGENPRQITFSASGGTAGSLSLDTSTSLLADAPLEGSWRAHDDPGTGLSKGYMRCRNFGTGYYLDISSHLRSGMVLTSLIAWVDPGSAQVTPADRMTVRVTYTVPDIDSEVSLNSAFSTDTASPQGITVPLLGHVVSRVNRQYLVHVISSQGAALGAEDILRGFTLSFTEPAGMGPRNY